MKVLVISHNVFCKTTNMGKTLMGYFDGIDPNDIAQFYIHSEIPTTDLCKNYYRITDKDAIKSIFTRKSGTVFCEKDIKFDAESSRTDSGNDAKRYQKARKRTPLVYLARNLWWSLGAWKTKKLLRWVDDFDPDVVFFASGDYAFMYKIALKIAKYKKIPLIVSCMDDYYFYNKNEKRFLGKFTHKLFMRQVEKTMKYSSEIFCICDKMSRDYGELFGKPTVTIHTRTTIVEPLNYGKTNAISYIGNLGYKRNEQLVKIGKALKELDIPEKPDFIDVYSGEKNPEILKDMTEENGIKFHGSISADKVLEVMGKSIAIIHTESFDPEMRKRVAYSVSTKIADSLASGTCIFALGPEDVASMEYLIENEAAVCVTSECFIKKELESIILDREKRLRTVKKAVLLAKEKHSADNNICIMLQDKFNF